MKKLRLQFLLFFVLLQSGILFLLFNSYRQMNIEEKSLWEAESVKIYNQMQAQVSDLLNLEDARPFLEYRFFQSKQSAVGKKLPSPLSDLSDMSRPKGWLGYFQMDPDGSFSTPYLPTLKDEAKSLPDYSQRLNKQEQIEKSTALFRKELKGAFANRSVSELPLKQVSKPRVLPALEHAKDEDLSRKSLPNIYPNPIMDRQESEGQKMKAASGAPSGAPADKAPQLSRRKEAVEESAVQAFAQSPASSVVSPLMEEAKQKGDVSSSKIIRKSIPQVKQITRKVPSESVQSAVVWLDPFQAKVSENNLIFFRRVWLDQKMYLQGFVLQTQTFFDGLMRNSFENSDLPKFSWVKWTFENALLAQYAQPVSRPSIQKVLFERDMAYPLNGIEWEIMGEAWPKISTRLYMNILFGGIFFFASFGLYWIYRSSAAQVILSQKRQDFVAAVTHELKTPLTSIRMYSEMLGDNWVSDESKKKEYYKNIQQESERLSRLIENVLQMARLEKQSYRLNPLKQNPSADFQNWAIQFAELASKEGFQFHLQLEANLPEIKYDPEALKEVLLILLENSVKFSRQASSKNLELNIKVRASNLEVIWRDYGPGVPSKESSQIFEKFYRVENELTRKTKGTGIGLAIAKMMVEEMGAKIEARNGNPTGLELVIRFPV